MTTHKSQSTGTCAFCGRELTRGGMARHLAACPERMEAIEEAARLPGRDQALYHLSAMEGWWGMFWLHLEIPGSATLANLDDYLRAIWLECCGHQSQFTLGGWAGKEVGMGRWVDQVFAPGVEVSHFYDFEAPSRTQITLVEVRQGRPLTMRPVLLMARNDLPYVPCQDCDQAALWVCLKCRSEEDKPGTLCNRHAGKHPKEHGDPQPLVNSPRAGMCKYTGPAEPPY